MEYFVYILYSEKCNKYYVGRTSSLEKRLFEHNNSKGGKFSVTCSPWKLMFSEKFPTRNDAIRREKEIKGRKSRKYIDSLINR